MFTNILDILQAFFGKKLGKSLAGIFIVFGLGVFAAYSLPHWLVTVDYLNAEVLRLSESSRKSDDWQELNLSELRKEMLQRQLWNLEDKIDNDKITPSIKYKNRLNSLQKDFDKINIRIDILKDRLRQNRNMK